MTDERSTNPPMSEIRVKPVRGWRERRIFLGFPWKIYAQDPLWVPPIYAERARISDPVKSPFIQRGGKVEFFIAWRDGKPAGTICAAEDVETNTRRGTRDCMIGFFECIEDGSVARALFTAAEDWARPRGLETLYGPFNLDYEEAYGVLVEGRNHPPALLCGHTPAYYEQFFVENGFVPAHRGAALPARDIRGACETQQGRGVLQRQFKGQVLPARW
ncbi:MAG: hypothetical protein HGA86_06365, partial [Anaerolineaceae bacterium]|nr:hypothetical protein [Anaerolineaceae bacterium]